MYFQEDDHFASERQLLLHCVTQDMATALSCSSLETPIAMTQSKSMVLEMIHLLQESFDAEKKQPT